MTFEEYEEFEERTRNKFPNIFRLNLNVADAMDYMINLYDKRGIDIPEDLFEMRDHVENESLVDTEKIPFDKYLYFSWIMSEYGKEN